MAEMPVLTALQLDPRKFRDPFVTAKGEPRAQVALRALDTLWFNTGTLCNLTCQNCYIESSPNNDRLTYLSAAEVGRYLDEIVALGLGTRLIGITGACWGMLGKSPEGVMCASSRMVVKHKGAVRPSVVACTLLPYDPLWDLGPSLAGASRAVPLNHPHCAKFCVLGGAACSRN